MYAIIHPEAIICNGPSNAQNGRRSLQTSYTYDRVAILQELGYWVNIWREPVSTKLSDNILKVETTSSEYCEL